MKKFMKYAAIYIGVSFVVLIIIAVFVNMGKDSKDKDNDPDTTSVSQDGNKAETRAKDSIQLISKTKEMIDILSELEEKKLIVTYKKPFDIILTIRRYQDNFLDRKESDIKSREIEELLAKEEQLLKKVLKRNYPEARTLLGPLLDEEFYSKDIDVIVSGTNKEDLTFQGGTFYRNQNKLDFLKLLEDQGIIAHYRFKNVRLKGSRIDDGDGWTYPTDKDDDIVRTYVD